MEVSQNRSCDRKAFEISYALFRVAAVSPNKGFSQYLEHYALELLDATVSENYQKSVRVSESIEYFIRLGGSVGLLNFENSQILTNETKSLIRLLQEAANAAKEEDFSLHETFSEIREAEDGDKPQSFKEEDIEQVRYPAMQDNPAVIAGFDHRYVVSSEIGNNRQPENSAEMRQKEILEKIRQNDNCRLKDLQTFFPNISERTLRYDIQKLIEEKEVERIGSGGPATFYRTQASGAAHANWHV